MALTPEARRQMQETLIEVAINYYSEHTYVNKDVIVNREWRKIPNYSVPVIGDQTFDVMIVRGLLQPTDERGMGYILTDKGWNYFYEKERRILEKQQTESVIKTNKMRTMQTFG